VRQGCGDRINVGPPLEQQVHVTDRQIDALQARRPSTDQPMAEIRSDRPDQVETLAQHHFQIPPIPQRARLDLNHEREYPRGVRHFPTDLIPLSKVVWYWSSARGSLIRMVLNDSSPADDVLLTVRPALSDVDLNELFSASWPGHQPASFEPKLSRSLTWIAARRGGRLVGDVNVIGDGGVHAFVLDTTVHPDERRRGLGVQLVQAAAAEARAHGAQWLHVDYEPHLESFYQQCGFRPTAAGLLRLA
jgi:hypothetical protein